MRTCLVLGGGDTLQDDIAAYGGPVDGAIAANDAGMVWPGELDAWVSLHATHWIGKGWVQGRADRGYPPARRHLGHGAAGRCHAGKELPEGVEFIPYKFPGQTRSGSSGLFAAKVALIDMGFDRVVLCGVPMDDRPHYWDEGRQPWKACETFRPAWQALAPEYRARMRSMSGWTRELLGGGWPRKMFGLS
ncbi:hypothetical protein [Mameliella alba]|uniref:Uncharacterized protein n=1 Tax=Mameliella alba TaxID=561184 RepID=A0A0B3S1A5_9RHOB|nr:hypothetical protein [Mameliella alba]KHQ50401.1 hypothetical protein OA50_05076 [Mameliella alba]